MNALSKAGEAITQHFADAQPISAISSPSQSRDYLEYSHHLRTTQPEHTTLVEEAAIAISINGITHAVMMATPEALQELAIGVALSDGILQHLSELRDIVIDDQHALTLNQYSVDITLSPRAQHRYKGISKARLGATGCGLCGVDSLTQAMPDLTPLIPAPLPSQRVIDHAREWLLEVQKKADISGGLHAACLISNEEEPLLGFEDIGRHNALDKVLGAAFLKEYDLHRHSVIMSSRCSHELVQKAIRAQLSTLVHLASPSQLAVDRANAHGLNLIHIPRHSAARIYAHSPDFD
jgi:FdhD protein